MRQPASRGFCIANLAAAFFLSGCAGIGPGPLATASDTTPGSVSVVPAVFRSQTGCRIETLLYRPSQPSVDVLAVLAPGFLRDQRHLRDLARALAVRGIPTLTLNPCASRPWGGRQVQTGADMRDIARRQGARRVVYGGFSAGALSALVAARLDERSTGVLGLDLVDNGGIGIGIARGLDRPLIGLRGDPSRCNAEGNGRQVFASAPRGRLSAIPGASHCDFESPTDRLCEVLCDGDRPGSWGHRQEILRRSVLAVTGLLAGPNPRYAGAAGREKRTLTSLGTR